MKIITFFSNNYITFSSIKDSKYVFRRCLNSLTKENKLIKHKQRREQQEILLIKLQMNPVYAGKNTSIKLKYSLQTVKLII